MRIHNDADTTIGVKWFFADEDAPWINVYNRFSSRNWDSIKGQTAGLGEVGGAPRPFFKGTNPGGLIGDHICGTKEMFRVGGSVRDDKLCTNAEGVSSCCVDKLFCCDLAKMGPFVDLVIVAATVGFPTPTTIGQVGMRFPMVRTAILPHVEFTTINTVILPPAISSFFFKITCMNDVIILASNSGLLGTVVPVANAHNKPPGIRFVPGDIEFILLPFNFNSETWTLAFGDDPGPPALPPPGNYVFPRGVFPPGFFPPGTFP